MFHSSEQPPPPRPEDAPEWNCVSYPGEGMHYVNKAGDCRWCGKEKADIKRELDALRNDF